MGSAKVSQTQPQTMERKWFKFWGSKDKESKKDKAKVRELKKNTTKERINHTKTNTNEQATVASILEPFKNLEIQNAKPAETNEKNDLDDFTVKVIKDRINSHSSQDSGFSDSSHDVAETLEKLTIQENEETEATNERNETDKENTKNKKKTIKVAVGRGPMKGKLPHCRTQPYVVDENSNRSISQINKHTLSGGQVIVNPTQETQEPTPSTEPEIVPPNIVATIYDTDPIFWEDILDKITKNPDIPLLPAEINLPEVTENVFSNPVPMSGQTFTDSAFGNFPFSPTSLYPSPPHSENIDSPSSDFHAYYPSTSDYTLSPERSSPINSEFEKYQMISPVSFDESSEDLKRDSVDRASCMSQSSMTMKNFKDLQKEISNGFSKKECCDIARKPTKEIFEEHLQKLKAAERRNLCMAVTQLDLKQCYGILHQSLLSLSKDCEQEDLQYSLFALVCQRVLAQNPALFAGDFGLSILKAAVLRCPHRPLLTRHVVHCVYLVLRSDPKLCSANDCVFHEVDALGDNLVIACARGGDSHALALAELTRSEPRGDMPPLFKLHHANSDGYSALHVACRQHSATSPHLHVVHVLLEHANADIWKGDIKGGDTALHLAVNSTTCCLKLIMLLFKQLDRKMWKKLAHAPNMSSVTPLEYARSATKSTTRHNYPHEVLDFLKKCR